MFRLKNIKLAGIRSKINKLRKRTGARLHFLFISACCSAFRILKKERNECRVLVIDFFAIGDAVTITPFIRNLKLNLSDRKIDVISSKLSKDVYLACEYVDEVLVFNEKMNRENKNPIIRPLNKIKYYFKMLRFCYNELFGKYDLAFVPRWDCDDERSADLMKLSGAVTRIGFSEKVTKLKVEANVGRDKYFTSTYSCRADCLESDKYLTLLEQAGYKIYDRSVKLPFRYLNSFKGIDLSMPYAVLALDTGNKERDWDTINFVKISEYLVYKNIKPILLGVNSVYDVKFKNAGGKGVSLIGRTSVSDTFDIIGNCKIYIGGDTGLSHIAGAVGACGIVINGRPRGGDPCHPSSPERFRPQSEFIRVLQPKKGSGVNSVLVEDVIEEIDRILPKEH